MSVDDTFGQELEEGFYPAYEQVEGPKGDVGSTGPRGEKGDTGEEGGAPLWQEDYDVLEVDTDTLPNERVAYWNNGIGVEGEFTGKRLDFPDPLNGPSPPAPPGPRDPNDPTYAGDEAWLQWDADMAVWRDRSPIQDPNDVEVGLWIEPKPGVYVTNALGKLYLFRQGQGAGGQHQTVKLGQFNFRAPDVDGEENALKLGHEAIDPTTGQVLDHRLAWFSDHLHAESVAGNIRAVNTLDQQLNEDGTINEARSPVGFAGPGEGAMGPQADDGMSFTVQMSDMAERNSGTGPWAVIVPPGCIVKVARIRLKRWARRHQFVRVTGEDFLVHPIGPEAVRGYWSAIDIEAGEITDWDSMPVTVPPQPPGAVTPWEAARWVNWSSTAFQGADPNNHLTDGQDMGAYGWDGNPYPLYGFWFALNYPLDGFVWAKGSWSRFQPRSSTPINNTPDVGKSLVMELILNYGAVDGTEESLFDTVHIVRADTPLDHSIGPVYRENVRSMHMRVYNFTTQPRDLRGADDDAYVAQGAGPPGAELTARWLGTQGHVPEMKFQQLTGRVKRFRLGTTGVFRRPYHGPN